MVTWSEASDAIGRWWERFWPWLASTLVVAIWQYFDSPFPSEPDSLFGAAAAVASVFASFLGVAQAIILSVKGSEAYRIIDDLGYTGLLFSFLRVGILAAVVFASLSILGFFISGDAVVGDYSVSTAFQSAWIFAGALSLFAYARISNILFKLLKQP